MLALKTNPMCLMLSEKKIYDGLDFLMNKMGWQRMLLQEFLWFFVIV